MSTTVVTGASHPSDDPPAARRMSEALTATTAADANREVAAARDETARDEVARVDLADPLVFRPVETVAVGAAGADRSESPDPPLVEPQISPVVIALVWVAVIVVGVAVVLYALEPMVAQRQQRKLAARYTAEITAATHQSSGLAGVEVPIEAPSTGSPVAALKIPALGLEQVVVEGVSPAQTQSGPGHVPGTAGPGQPGNSVIVGRRAMFGAPFARLGRLQADDEIVVTTTQGQSRYHVTEVRHQALEAGGPGLASAAPTSSTTSTTAASTETTAPSTGATAGTTETTGDVTDDATAGDTVAISTLYGPTSDDRLTLVTAAGVTPWNTSVATVVVARLDGTPFAPTPQGGRTHDQTGTSGDPSAWAATALIGTALGGTAVAAVWFGRRLSMRLTFLLVGVPLLGLTVVLAESGSRLLPGWV